MTAEKALYSFTQYMANALQGSGITVYDEKPPDTDPTYPYLCIQGGNERIENGWLFKRLVQGWIAVKREDQRQLNYTMGRITSMIIDISRDIGEIDKLDLPDNPTKVIGKVGCRISGSIVDQSSSDLDEARKVITWELSGNCR